MPKSVVPREDRSQCQVSTNESAESTAIDQSQVWKEGQQMTSPKRGDVATGGMPLTIELHGACCKILFSFGHSQWFRYWFPYKHRQLCSWWFAMRRVYNVALINLLFHVPYKQSSQVINYMSSVICRFFYLKIHQKGLRWHNWWMRFFCWTFILPKRMPLRRKFIAVFVLGKMRLLYERVRRHSRQPYPPPTKHMVSFAKICTFLYVSFVRVETKEEYIKE